MRMEIKSVETKSDRKDFVTKVLKLGREKEDGNGVQRSNE